MIFSRRSSRRFSGDDDEDVELFARLGFAIIEDVPRREVSAEEREHWGFAEGTTMAGHTLLEFGV